jgi:hypothetical protein
MTNPTMRGCERFLVAAQSFVTAAALMPGHTGVGFSARSIGHQSANWAAPYKKKLRMIRMRPSRRSPTAPISIATEPFDQRA